MAPARPATTTTVTAPAPEPTSQPAPPATPGTPAETPPAIVAFFERSERSEVLARNGLGPGPLAHLFRRLCDEFHRGVPVEQLFVSYSEEVATRSAGEGPELRAAFADAFGACVPTPSPKTAPDPPGREISPECRKCRS